MADWPKRKRLEATIAGQKPDRPPVALWRHWPGDDQDAAALAAAHLKWQQDYDWDLIKVSPSSSYCLQDWGIEDRWVGEIEGTRQYTNRVIKRPSDWETLKPLDPGKGMLATQIEALRLIGQGLGQEVPFMATIFSPLSQAKNLAGDRQMMAWMRSHADAFHKGLKTITESTVRTVEAAKATGIDGIYYAVQHASYALMNPAEYGAFGRPYDEQILAAAAGLDFNMLHIHGTDIIFEAVADYPVQFVNWHDQENEISLAEGLQHIKGAASGGVSRWTLHQDSPGPALAEARRALEQTDGRRLLLGTGCVSMVTTPTGNIRALRQVVEN